MEPIRPEPGDLIVTRGRGSLSWLIRQVTRSPVNHAGVIVAPWPASSQVMRTVEALAPGVVRRLRVQGSDMVVVLRVSEDLATRGRIVYEAGKLADRRPRIRYGYLDLLALGLMQYGIRPRLVRRVVARSDRMICSQAADEACRRAGVHLFDDGREPQDVTPGDLLWRGVLTGARTAAWSPLPRSEDSHGRHVSSR